MKTAEEQYIAFLQPLEATNCRKGLWGPGAP